MKFQIPNNKFQMQPFFNLLLFVWLLFGIWYLMLDAFVVYAQESPQFLITWRADAYVPPFYQEKILPTRGTPVTVRFELIDRSKIADLTRTEIRWLLDGKLQQSGRGLKTFNFAVSEYPGRSHEIRVAIPSRNLNKTVFVPVAAPRVAIDTPYPFKQITQGSTAKLAAYSFFFNISDLSDLFFTWKIDSRIVNGLGQAASVLNLDTEPTAAGTTATVGVTIQNVSAAGELAKSEKRLLIK